MDALQGYIRADFQDEELKKGLTIGKKDVLLKMLQNKLRELETEKKAKQRNVRANMKVNRLLNTVLKDYQDKQKKILAMKEKQQQQIYAIIEYLEKSMKSIGVSSSKLKQVAFERKRLLREIDSIQKEIDDILDVDVDADVEVSEEEEEEAEK
jgi:hypothetical protein